MVEFGTDCGAKDAGEIVEGAESSDNLRGDPSLDARPEAAGMMPLSGNSPAVARFVCLESGCVANPVAHGSPPGESPPMGQTGSLEAWEPVVLTLKGRYRICWCADHSWDPLTLQSRGDCAFSSAFGVEVGEVRVVGVDEAQQFECGAFRPCTLLIGSAKGGLQSTDAVMLLRYNAHVARRDFGQGWGPDGNGPQLFGGDGAELCGSAGVGGRERGVLVEAIPGVGDAQKRSFDLGPHGAGPIGVFRVCYCQNSVMRSCSSSSAQNFAQEVGVLNVVLRALTQGFSVICRGPGVR